MKHYIYRVVAYENIRPYTLRIRFDDGKQQEIDFSPVLTGEIYGPLRDEKLFNQVAIDEEVHTLIWPNGADFDPETLYNWHMYVKEIKRIVQQSELETTAAG